MCRNHTFRSLRSWLKITHHRDRILLQFVNQSWRHPMRGETRTNDFVTLDPSHFLSHFLHFDFFLPLRIQGFHTWNHSYRVINNIWWQVNLPVNVLDGKTSSKATRIPNNCAVTVVGRTAGCTGICGIVCKEAAFLDNISVMWAGSQTCSPEDPWDDCTVHLPTQSDTNGWFYGR